MDAKLEVCLLVKGFEQKKNIASTHAAGSYFLNCSKTVTGSATEQKWLLLWWWHAFLKILFVQEGAVQLKVPKCSEVKEDSLDRQGSQEQPGSLFKGKVRGQK